jgi:hypothetical protein
LLAVVALYLIWVAGFPDLDEASLPREQQASRIARTLAIVGGVVALGIVGVILIRVSESSTFRDLLAVVVLIALPILFLVVAWKSRRDRRN